MTMLVAQQIAEPMNFLPRHFRSRIFHGLRQILCRFGNYLPRFNVCLLLVERRRPCLHKLIGLDLV